jgi:phosphoenolpyruvate synthase/pyruvate phosphate dikinase
MTTQTLEGPVAKSGTKRSDYIRWFDEIGIDDIPLVGGKTMIAQVIAACRTKKRKIGICGQAPSDYPEFAQFLVEQGIDSISLNPDTVLKTTLAILEKERSKP